jgi:nucleoside-diphosphate-sugar epimerase
MSIVLPVYSEGKAVEPVLRALSAGIRFRWVSDKPFAHDVQLRAPDVTKAREVLGYEATTPLETMLDDVIPWIRDEVGAGRL